MSEIITDNENSAFLETKCCIEHEGMTFCSGGSYLLKRKDTGKMEGMMYASHKPDKDGNMCVTSWDGSLSIRATYGHVYRDNFGGKRCNVYFRYSGKYFWGKWYGMENADVIRCKEITEKSYFGFNLTRKGE